MENCYSNMLKQNYFELHMREYVQQMKRKRFQMNWYQII